MNAHIFRLQALGIGDMTLYLLLWIRPGNVTLPDLYLIMWCRSVSHKICQILCRSPSSWLWPIGAFWLWFVMSGTRTPASCSLGCWVGSWVTCMSSTTQCLQQNISISWSMVQHGDTVVSTVALQARSWFKPAAWRGSYVRSLPVLPVLTWVLCWHSVFLTPWRHAS